MPRPRRRTARPPSLSPLLRRKCWALRSCARERQSRCAAAGGAHLLRSAHRARTEAEALAQLELRLDNLVDVCERQAQRIARLEAENRAREAENKALREAVTLHADLLQHYRLTAGI